MTEISSASDEVANGAPTSDEFISLSPVAAPGVGDGDSIRSGNPSALPAGNNNLYYIIGGAAAGCLCLLLACGACIVLRKRRDDPRSVDAVSALDSTELPMAQFSEYGSASAALGQSSPRTHEYGSAQVPAQNRTQEYGDASALTGSLSQTEYASTGIPNSTSINYSSLAPNSTGGSSGVIYDQALVGQPPAVSYEQFPE